MTGDAGLQAVQAAKHPALQTDKELEEQLGELLLAEKLPPYLAFSRDTQPAIFSSGIDKQVPSLASRLAWGACQRMVQATMLMLL